MFYVSKILFHFLSHVLKLTKRLDTNQLKSGLLHLQIFFPQYFSSLKPNINYILDAVPSFTVFDTFAKEDWGVNLTTIKMKFQLDVRRDSSRV
jgi:hypothetical protein